MEKQLKEQHWQRNKTLSERNERMFTHELATDVTFRVSFMEGEAKTIKSHKYKLISASAVFWSMFCGELQESGNVDVTDVEPEAFREMLRYIYTEKAEINGHNVMHVLHAAKKYDIPSLVKQCVDFMDKGLDTSNVFTILEHSIFFEENDLSVKCVDHIEKHTEEAFQSDAFMDISQETLAFALESDKLKMEEVQIFKLCCKWGKEKKQDKSSLRDVLGKALYKIRFPVMPPSDFTNVVRPTEVLTKDEQLDIYTYVTSPEEKNKPPLFSCVKRKSRNRAIAVGDRVRVKKSVTTPNLGWGLNVNHESIGVVTRINGDYLFIRFPRHRNWEGHLEEMELV